MFRLTAEEADCLRFQNGISKNRGGRRHLPYAFTEHGVVMLCPVLKSPSVSGPCRDHFTVTRFRP
jgi:hypothetical protein